MENKDTNLPCCLLMSSGHHDPRNPTKGACEAPQWIEVVMVAEAKKEAEEEGVGEEVVVNPMQNEMTIRRIEAK